MKKNIVPVQAFVVFVWIALGCNPKVPSTIDEAEVLHQNQDQLTQIIIYDVFTPPVASRIYVYSSLASYEAIRHLDKNAESIAARLNGFAAMPQPEQGKSYNFTLAATRAFFKVVRNVRVFSVDSLDKYERATYKRFEESVTKETYDRSIAFGDSIAILILKRAATDGYALSRGKAKHLGSNEPGKWRPTPPDYLDAVEWCWNTMKPMVLDSASQFMPPRPPAYSKDTASLFYKYAKEVHDISKNLSIEQQEIARYWDDNPFVMEHAGHTMFANKKITPGGHWMGIAAIASRQSNADVVKIAKSYALTAIALYDGFIACWDEKYRSNVVRPVTVINEWFDPNWSPFLQTPPFPEYTSGHSTITAAAASVLEELYGDNFSFLDTSDLRYIGMQRKFNSFREAADEASISRVYGGIHYRTGAEAGQEQGKKVGALVIDKILRKKN
jgi:hypothetical protein